MKFGRLVTTCGLAALVCWSPIAPTLAQQAPAAAAQQDTSDEAKVAPVAPELRDGARQALKYSRMWGKFDDASIQKLRNGPPPPMAPILPDVSAEERMIPGPAGAPQVRIYVINAKAGGNRPGILHTHGGGHILGSARNDVPRLQALARELDCVIVTVDYRLAPETDYRGSTEDNYAGLRWMHDHAAELGLDKTRLAVMGESAGGTHAALLAINARDRGEVPVAFQALIYPMLDDRTGGVVKLPPHIATVGWDADSNQYGWQAFLGQRPGTKHVPTAAVPARTPKVTGLPPAFIIVGGVDLFVNEDIDYARRLNAAGVPTELVVMPGVYHGFDGLSPDTPLARQFMAAKLTALRRAFGLSAK